MVSSLLKNHRTMRNAIACALLLVTCCRMDGPAQALGPTAFDRYQTTGSLTRQGVVDPAHQQEKEFADPGTIRGLVVNGSRDQIAVSGTEVVLRARLQGQFDVISMTTTDARGRFQFENLPVDAGIQYVPGANHGEVHYPGPRLELTAVKQDIQAKIVIYETSNGPSPLVMEQHDILVQPQPGALEVTESMVILNPSNRSFVGQPTQGNNRTVTLQLAIPSNFERVTFTKEFYGRRFALVDGKLRTDIPWPPGRRQLKFTYVLPHDLGPVDWHRPVDLPCSLLRLTVLTDKPEEVHCDLDGRRSTIDNRVTFTSSGVTLPAGQELHLQMGSAVVPTMVYGRWAALTILGLLIGGTGAVLYRASRMERSGVEVGVEELKK